MLDDSPDVARRPPRAPGIVGTCAICGALRLVDETKQTVWVGLWTDTPDCASCAAWLDALDVELRSLGCRVRDG